MNLVLRRTKKHDDYTIGELYVDGEFQCFTLEDPVTLVKIKGESAIPAGRYRVSVTYSPRFKREMPLLHDVAGFEGVRIHPGNRTSDTEGCILVGNRATDGYLEESKMAYTDLFNKLQGATSPITIIIS